MNLSLIKENAISAAYIIDNVAKPVTDYSTKLDKHKPSDLEQLCQISVCFNMIVHSTQTSLTTIH